MNTSVNHEFPDGGLFQMAAEEEWIQANDIDWNSREINFDGNWRFYLGDAQDARDVCFDDSHWLPISLPHDYSIGQPYSQAMEAQSGYLPGGVGWYRKCFFLPGHLTDKHIRLDFDGVYMNATVWMNGTKLGTHPYGYSPFSFDLTPHLIWGQENVLAVKVDHKTPSSRWYSGSGIYRSVSLALLDGLHVGFNGIRITTPNLEQEAGGRTALVIRTVIDNESPSLAQVILRHTVYKKDDSPELCIGAFTAANPVTVLPGESRAAEYGFTTISPPLLWSPEHPEVYTVKTEVVTGGRIRDCCYTDVGFRFFHFDQDAGFFLNGKATKLKGVCLHHDQGALGAAAHRRAMERQAGLLTDMGCNSIRITHNPAAGSMIDICSRKGILVAEELFDGWNCSKNGNTEDYGKWFSGKIEEDNAILGGAPGMSWAEFDLKATMNRDINAPCVFMWSLGNEVMEGTGDSIEPFPDIAARLIQWAKETDRTRPVTTGDDQLKTGHPESIRIGCLLDEAGGTVGFNYTSLDQLDHYHREHPSWKIYGAETASSINSRGVYNPELYDRQFTSYDEAAVAWGHYASQSWYDTIRKDYVAGTYVWTGFDYIGEPTNYNGIAPGAASLPWPSPKNSYFGIIDTAGFPKDSYYLYQSLWNPGVATLHILPAWSGKVVQMNERGEVRAAVYTNARSVELLFTPSGTGETVSLGRKTFTVKTSQGGGYTYQLYEGEDACADPYRNLYLTWTVPYADGTLTARGFDEQGRLITNTLGRSFAATPDPPARLRLTADRDVLDGDGRDLCYITADIEDSQGNLVPDAGDLISFHVRGVGVIAGVDNGLSVDHGSYQAHSRNAFNGKALVIVRALDSRNAFCGKSPAWGKDFKEMDSFTLLASAPGLAEASVTVRVRPGASRKPLEKQVAGWRMVRNYYVLAGSVPHLPDQLTALYSDNTTSNQPVVWDEVEKERLSQAGSFPLTGTVKGLAVCIHIHILDPISSVLNYSGAVPPDTKPILPTSRQALGADGKILGVSLPVLWDRPKEGGYVKEGITVIRGRVNAFGRQLPVTASIRVQTLTYTITDNVAPKSQLSQTVPPDLVSDHLNGIIRDTKAETAENNSSRFPGPMLWSNRNYTQRKPGAQPASLIFSYDTQELLGRANIDFCSGGNCLRFPDPRTTLWFISNIGPKGPWTLLKTRESIDEESASMGVKRYTYDFEPVMATYLRLEIHNTRNPVPPVPAESTASTGIAKAELLRAETSFATNSWAEISSIVLNGIQIPPESWSKGEFFSPEETAESLEVRSEYNAAITILPAHNKTIRILTESEDHKERREYLIHLGMETSVRSL